MYMYLSHRIRRMFLSGACPQNLSPKKPLSLKDQRFLQKIKLDKNLSRTLVKQQKLLREKHIGLLAKHFNEGNTDRNSRKMSFREKDQLELKRKNPSIYLQVLCKADQTIKTQNSKALQTDKICIARSDPKEQCKLESYGFWRKSLTLFVQHLKVKKRVLANSFISGNVKGYGKRIGDAPLGPFLGFQNTLSDKDISHKKNETIENLQINQARPLFLKGLRSFGYTNCHYLYDHESLKTCIVPQIFKNQKPISRAKTLLQERKKIALLYGQLAKKDIVNISRKASTLPGFFEDNMFTLLESRVDVCVFRAGFSKTIASARQLIRNGFVLVNGKKISSCKRRAKPGDYFTVKELLNPYRNTTFELYNLCLSSNFLRQWVFLNKTKFFRKLALNIQPKQLKEKKTKSFTTIPESLLVHYPVALYFPSNTNNSNYSKEKSKGFCSSLYWGFFLYKLEKIPPFSCFLDTKKKSNIFESSAEFVLGSCKPSASAKAGLVKKKKQREENGYHNSRVSLSLASFSKPTTIGNDCFEGQSNRGKHLECLDNRGIKQQALARHFNPKVLEQQKLDALKKNQRAIKDLEVAFSLSRNPQILQKKKSLAEQSVKTNEEKLLWLSSLATSKCNGQTNFKVLAFASNHVPLGYASQARCSERPSILFDKKERALCLQRTLLDSRSYAERRKNKRVLESKKNKNIVLLNLYTQLLLKKLQGLKKKRLSSRPYFLFSQNLPSSNLWAIWGQKPLHLEISHKTGGFIYLYKPQKILSPVCLDFKL